MSQQASYADNYRGINFRKHPEKYVIGRGEQGVLIAEPYKSEILPYWKFATPELAETSAQTIFAMFQDYKQRGDFVGMDMARKFLQMGFTRARRYANHPSGRKYDAQGRVQAQDKGWQTAPKAKSADIFYQYFRRAAEDEIYRLLKVDHATRQSTGDTLHQ